jgi:acyl-CoA dehydrogenase
MQVDLAATTALVFHTAASLELHAALADARAHLRFRTLAPLVKYRAGEQNVDFARAAVELLGGNGYVSDFPTARLLRDAQVNTIWEGTSNICALDLLRAIDRQEGDAAVLDHADAQLDELSVPAGVRVAQHARRSIEAARRGIAGLAGASRERREQQARRLADLFGDAVALAALAREADFEARNGDWRKALTAELFAMRADDHGPALGRLLDGLHGVPEIYPAMFSDQPLDEASYDAALRTLDQDKEQTCTSR